MTGMNDKKMGPVKCKMSLSRDVKLRVVYGHNNSQPLNEQLGVTYVHALMRRR